MIICHPFIENEPKVQSGSTLNIQAHKNSMNMSCHEIRYTDWVIEMGTTNVCKRKGLLDLELPRPCRKTYHYIYISYTCCTSNSQRISSAPCIFVGKFKICWMPKNYRDRGIFPCRLLMLLLPSTSKWIINHRAAPCRIHKVHSNAISKNILTIG